MKTVIYIIVDVSGSMNEMGKTLLQRNLCRYASQLREIDQKKYANVDIRFYEWAQDIFEVIHQENNDIPALKAECSSNLNSLSSFLTKELYGIDKPSVLVLSDGYFERDDFEQFVEWKNNNAEVFIQTVAVGADADLLKLKKISTNNRVYLAENIALAIDSAIFDSDASYIAPDSTAQILQSDSAEAEEVEGDWDA